MNLNQRAEYLAQTYADAILRLSYTYLKNTQDAQDICQTVFVKLLTEPREFESSAHERAYVLRMASNACKDILKSPWRKKTCGLETCMELPAPEEADGSLLAAVGSMLYFTNYPYVTPTAGAMPGLKAFVAAVFGGIGSVPGAVVGAFIIGICENIIKGLDVILIKAGLSKQMLGLTTFSDAFTFALLIVILIVKPTGLFGEKTTDKV